MTEAAAAAAETTAVTRLSTLDRLLPVWIAVAMATGLLMGRWVPGFNAALQKVQIDGISLPIALGLLIMMYPVLAKVRYDRLHTVTSDRRLLISRCCCAGLAPFAFPGVPPAQLQAVPSTTGRASRIRS